MAAAGWFMSSQSSSPRIGGWRKPYSVLDLIFRTKLYRLTLPRHAVIPTGHIPTNMWPGDADRGGIIVQGDFELAGRAIREAEAPWLAGGISTDWLATVSTFDWLRDLRTAGSEAARGRA